MAMARKQVGKSHASKRFVRQDHSGRWFAAARWSGSRSDSFTDLKLHGNVSWKALQLVILRCCGCGRTRPR